MRTASGSEIDAKQRRVGRATLNGFETKGIVRPAHRLARCWTRRQADARAREISEAERKSHFRLGRYRILGPLTASG